MWEYASAETKELAGAPETEIEITPEMVEAGAEAYLEHDSRFENVDAGAVRVYLAMRRIALLRHPEDG